MNQLITKSLSYATEKHKGQVDDDGIEYIFHPIQVFRILSKVTQDPELLTAALLHDVLEDTGTTPEEIEQIFGRRVLSLVMEVTHEGKKDNHGFYFPRLKTRDGIMIKFADRLSNISRMSNWDKKRQEHYLNHSKFWNGEV